MYDDHEQASDIAADERAFGLPRGSIAEINAACEAFFRRRGMPASGSSWRRRPTIPAAEVPRSCPPMRVDALPPAPDAPVLMLPAPASTEPEPAISPAPVTPTATTIIMSTEPNSPNADETRDPVELLIDLAVAANVVVGCALALEDGPRLTTAVRTFEAHLRTAREAGLVQPSTQA